MTGQRPSILLVEDDPDLRLLIGEELEDAGYDVLAAADGLEALDIATHKAPALIISDVMMPRLDGIGLYHRLRDLPEVSGRPFIFLTALQDPTHDERLSTCAGVVFCRKPIDFGAFLTTVASCLDTPA
jgi:CheY-like chemotaxis protein